MRQDQMDAVRSMLSDLAQTHMKAALVLDQLQDVVAVEALPTVRRGLLPRAEESTFCVIWSDRKCQLGHTKSFLLFAKLLHRSNHFVHYDHLLRDVWGGDIRSHGTVRSAIRELKSKLCRAKMQKLARVIEGQGCHYGLMLERL